MRYLLTSHIRFIITIFASASLAYDDDYSCNNTICSPRAGDLLIGRDSALNADSTCGLNKIETYCVVTASGKSRCNECSSKQAYNRITNPNSHRIGNVVSRVPSDEGRWWQSENAAHNVSISLNLETQFQFISTILRFKTFRPAAMYLERSNNFGQTWRPYAYFSNNCPRDYPSIPQRPRSKLDDVTCTSIYSQLTPSEGGVVAFMAAPSEMHANLPLYSEERQNLTAITNLRVTFTRLNTLGDMQLDDSTAIKRKYYYAVYEWNVWGRCSCFGHATRCKPRSQNEILNKEKVYGVCECTHYTAGDNCERCADFYQSKPWLPATRGSSNACERCECHGHTEMCFFSPILYLESRNISGGHCYQCRHNTEGVQCEFCKPGYYRYPSYPIDHPQTCQPCSCHADGSKDHEHCEQYTNPGQNTIAGRCVCKDNVGGDKCDRCRVGYWNFKATNSAGCEDCKCHMLGTLHNSGCDQITGACTCKRFVEGENCDKCLPGYFNLTSSALGCQPCACNVVGSVSGDCGEDTEGCTCKNGFTGRACDKVEDGYFVKTPQEIIEQPGIPVVIPIEGPKNSGQHIIVIAVDPKHFGPSDQWIFTISPTQLNSRCKNKNYTVHITKDTDKLIIPDVCFEGDKKTIISVNPNQRYGDPYTQIIIGNIITIPDDGGAGQIADFCERYRETAEEIKQGLAEPSRMPEQCQAYFRLSAIHWKDTGAVTVPCACNVTGSITPVCDKATGQCPCKPGVTGRVCDQCEIYHYHFGVGGCTACDCDQQGSLSLQCDTLTSQCLCRPGIKGRQCDQCSSGHWNFPSCRKCECNGYSETCDKATGQCFNCLENTGGHTCDKCANGYYGDPLRGVPCRPCECPGGGVEHSEGCSVHPVAGMVCHCKRGFTGPRCSECSPNYYGNPTELGGTCRPCECSGNLPPEGGCDQVSGVCFNCLHNTEGEHCQQCIDGFWGNATQQSCQPCSCNRLGTVVDSDKSGCKETTCDRSTGVCNCLPNVLGPRCFECAPLHFNISSGLGCEACACDPAGSLHLECHPNTGACACKSDRSGRRCDQCQRTYFGDPQGPAGCQKCDCDRSGSASNSCEPISGQCVCRPGIAGRTCDRCSRGTTGQLPNCIPCGECWTNWDDAITELLENMKQMQNQTANQLPADLKPIYDILQGLVKQIELLPGSNLTDAQLNQLEETLLLTEQRINSLESHDGDSGKLHEALKALQKLENEQTNVGNLLQEHQDFLKLLSTNLYNLIDSSKNISIHNPHGAYAALMTALNEAKKIEALQAELEGRRRRLDALHQSAADGVGERQVADEELKRLTKLLSERIKDLQEEIRQLNRLVCGDNQQTSDSRADPATCPSACGGASCDPISFNIFSLKEHQSAMTLARVSESAVGSSFGVISGCAGPPRCTLSSEARLKDLLKEHLDLQNDLGNILQSSALVDYLVSDVNVSRSEAEMIQQDSTQKLKTLTLRLERVHNLTDSIIEEAMTAKHSYRNLTLERYNKLVERIRSLQHTVNLPAAIRLGAQLQQLAERLRDGIERIFAETEEDRQQASQLLARAERIRKNAQTFLDQMNQLAEVNKLYDDLENSPTFSALDASLAFQAEKTKVNQALDRLEQDREMISQDISAQADQASQNAATASRLWQETQTSKRLGRQSLQELQTLNSTFIQLDEKMDAIDELMDKIVGKDPAGDSGAIEDPSELAKQVNDYVDKLEASLKELDELKKPLDDMENESADLTMKLEQMVNKFKTLSTKLSPQAKHQRFCS